MATTINLTREGNGVHSFDSFEHKYVLEYVPDPVVRGAYGYTLKRGGDEPVALADFPNLSAARKWVTLLGFSALDALPSAESATEAESAEVATNE